MNYSNYNLNDFLMDESFQQWVLFPTTTSNNFWQQILEDNPEKRETVDQARAILNTIGYKKTQISRQEKETILNSILTSVHAEGSNRRSITAELNKYFAPNFTIKPSFELRKGSSMFFRGVAASFVGALLIIGGFYFLDYFNQNKEVAAIEYLEKSSLKGEKSNIILSDGTKVKLNSNSRLIFPRHFSKVERKVTLIVEAYFEVKKDASRPFAIISNDVKTVVLGTSFNVRAYPSESMIKVAVSEGKVSVERKVDDSQLSNNDPVLLVPNEMAVYSKESGNTSKGSFDPTEVFGWKDGILYFKDADIYQTIERLEKWYGVTFVVKTQLNEDKDLSGSFKNKSLESVLDGLSYVFGFEFEINGKKVTLK